MWAGLCCGKTATRINATGGAICSSLCACQLAPLPWQAPHLGTHSCRWFTSAWSSKLPQRPRTMTAVSEPLSRLKRWPCSRCPITVSAPVVEMSGQGLFIPTAGLRRAARLNAPWSTLPVWTTAMLPTSSQFVAGLGNPSFSQGLVRHMPIASCDADLASLALAGKQGTVLSQYY